MLRHVLELVTTNQGTISQADLCEDMELTPEMLEGLLASLVRMGRLVEVEDSRPEVCPKCEDCNIGEPCGWVSMFQEKRYEVVDTGYQV
jgi:hypothetical protein